jgi:hypothetical protein
MPNARALRLVLPRRPLQISAAALAGRVALAGWCLALAACGGAAGTGSPLGNGPDTAAASGSPASGSSSSISPSSASSPSASASQAQGASPQAASASQTIQTSRVGTVIYLQSTYSGHSARVGLDTAWGGAIVEASFDGTNYVNAYDPGREVQASVYDGAAAYDSCSGCTGVWGWNPVQGGDRYGHGSGALASTLGADTLYVKSQPLQWNPDAFGGGRTKAVPSDITVEETVSVVPGAPLAFHFEYEIRYLGSGQHYNTRQELPAVFAVAPTGMLTYYGGIKPWTNGALSQAQVPALPKMTANLYSPEQWAAFTDADNMGLTIYVPGQYPYVSASSMPVGGGGPSGKAYSYLHPFTSLTFGPSTVYHGNLYLLPGNVNDARTAVYALHGSVPPVDIFAPIGNLEAPAHNAVLRGKSARVSGWALDNVAVADIEVRLDGVTLGHPGLTIRRPDVVAAYPHLAPLLSGWALQFDSTAFPNGAHILTVRLTDTSGNVAVLPPVNVTVSNG